MYPGKCFKRDSVTTLQPKSMVACAYDNQTMIKRWLLLHQPLLITDQLGIPPRQPPHLPGSKRPSLSNQLSLSSMKPVLRRRMNPIDKFASHSSNTRQLHTNSENVLPIIELNGIIQKTPIPNKDRAPLTSRIPLNSSSASMQHTPSANKSNSPLTSHFASAILSGSSKAKICNIMTPLISPSARRLSNIVLSDIFYDNSAICNSSCTESTSIHDTTSKRSIFQLPASTILPKSLAVYWTINKDALHVKLADELVCVGEAMSN